MIAFLELLYLVWEMKKDTSKVNRDNAAVICGNIFSVEITKIMEIGFDYIMPGILNDE